MSRININGNQLTIEQVVQVARYGYEIEIEAAAQSAITRSREIVDRFVEEKRNVYGITTGFGKFSDIAISKEETKELQRNLIISHACGVGPFLSEEISRAIMVLRVKIGRAHV